MPPIPQAILDEMRGVSMHDGCPVAPGELALVRVRHVDYEGREREGEIIVLAELEDEVAAIFAELFAARFPLHRVERVDAFGGSDERSMEADNSSSFNHRQNLSFALRDPNTTVLSLHAYGRAIDINPLRNPYARPRANPSVIQPRSGAPYLDRSLALPGMIREGDACHRAFTERGWEWGGSWADRVDFQHFEKPGF